eukprot:TRINITY_DN168_c0_g3_i1.p1 TRINITY_DN168_c0_g3~~TRINITY_DN168_c0_g3_i1.p1  ORF type:complete len:289 (-),score=83.21 TRINITY_DN168_c0_g3_i1:301-1167(-)
MSSSSSSSSFSSSSLSSSSSSSSSTSSSSSSSSFTTISPISSSFSSSSASLDPTSDFEFTVAVVGDGGVGKSTIVESLTKQKCPESFEGIHFQTKYYKQALDLRTDSQRKKQPIVESLPKYVIKVNVWSVPGNERYMDLTCRLAAGSMGLVLVFDVNNKATLADLETWISEIEKNKPCANRIFVGNQVDSTQREVLRSAAQKLADKYNSPYFETSAIKNLGVSKAFRTLVRSICVKHLTGKSPALLKKAQHILPSNIRVGSRLLGSNVSMLPIRKYSLSHDCTLAFDW